jgi:hypothetical protein
MGGKPKYSAAFVLDLEQHAPVIHQIAEARKQIIAEEFNNVAPPRPLPIKKGEEKYPEKEFYRGKLILNASAAEKSKPFVVDQDVSAIMDESAIYPGLIVNAAIDVYAYKMQGASGITFGLTGIQAVRDGERLDNRPEVDELFDQVPRTDGFTSTDAPQQDTDVSDLY